MSKQSQLARLLPRPIRTSFRAKLLLVLLVLGVVNSIGASVYFGRLQRQILLTEVRTLMLATVVQMAEGLDAEAIERLAQSEDVRAEGEFRTERDRLVRMRGAIVRAIDVPENDTTADEVFVDLYVLAPTDRPGWGRLIITYDEEDAGRDYDMSRFPVMMQGWERPIVERAMYRDEYGTTVSGYAPVLNEDGETIALVGVDVADVYFYTVALVSIVFAALMFAVTLALSWVIAAWVSRAMSRPLTQLTTAMRRVGGGDLKASLSPTGSGDEFDQLVTQFNAMVGGLRDRETFRRDLGEAAVIQRGLLPVAAPMIPGFDVAGGIRYCQHTGGDYYDYVALAPGVESDAAGPSPWGIVVGDVAGHGAGSALLMCSARAALRSAARVAGADVSRLMRRLNEHLLEDSASGTFMTMFYGVVDPENATLTWTSAGHEPGLLWRAETRTVEHLGSTDIPLGILDGREFERGHEVRLGAGDVLLIATDGATQARDALGAFFGFDRLAAIIGANAGASAREIRDAVIEGALSHEAADHPEDDVTVVVLKRSV